MTHSSNSSNPAISKTVIVLLGIIALVLGLVFYKYNQPKPLDKEQLKSQGLYLFDTARSLTHFELINHNGQAFSPSNFQGAWTIVFFGYTYCPDICPTTMATLNSMLKDLKTALPQTNNAPANTALNIVMVTVDPERDTHSQLSNYVPFFNPDFTGITGDVEQIAKLATALNAVFAKAPLTKEQVESDNYLVDHSANLALINPAGMYQGFFRPPFEPKKMSKVLSQVMSSTTL